MMIRRFVPIAACALLVAGCDEWTSASQLIAPSERDDIGLSGVYENDAVTMTVTPLAERRYRLTYDDGSGETIAGAPKDVRAAFDLLRSQPLVGEDGSVEGYRNTYLIEFERPSDNGPPRYAYDILVVESGGFIEDFNVRCSRATQAIIGQTDESAGCEFTSYAQLRAAAADALAWADDARMEIRRDSFVRSQQ